VAPQALAKSRRRLAVAEPTEVPAQENPPGVVAPPGAGTPANASAELAVARFLRSFQVLVLSARLYQKNHPRVMENLEAAEKRLRRALEFFSPLHVAVERGRLVVPMPGLDAPGGALADQHGELGTLAEELFRCGITAINFLPHTNLGELDKLAYLLNSAPQKTGPIPPLGGGKRPAPSAPAPSWPARSVWRTRPFSDTSTSSARRSWSGNSRAGKRTSASVR